MQAMSKKFQKLKQFKAMMLQNVMKTHTHCAQYFQNEKSPKTHIHSVFFCCCYIFTCSGDLWTDIVFFFIPDNISFTVSRTNTEYIFFLLF